MAEKFEEIAVVVDQSSLGNGIYDLTLKTDKIAKAAKAGQFVSVYSNDKSKLLPRPISLCGINRDDDLQYSRERRHFLSAEESECRLCCSLPRI